MKSLINLLGLIFAISSIQLQALAQIYHPSASQIYYPSASFFNPSASLFRGSQDLEYLKGWLNIHDASYFASLLADSNFESALNNKEKTITLIAPIDEAFNNLAIENKDKLFDTEEKNKLVEYHWIPGAISEDDIQNQKVTSSDGNIIKITGILLEDQSEAILLNDNSKIQKIEKISDNLIVVLIDEVLTPQTKIQ